ncbi:cytidine deaminase [Alphaproteobacteria bacterium]|jgi:cytidine deaminase|nr:cytidine deaminase [Alphaproteobacteria bacterium]MBT5799719.1 cytidine deaminase [Alphaproteobacteria bacterium]MDA9816429.1 cytidine deaminase [Alphaproteobacteria bacterium]MDC0394394.1 cytidine deaminase [Alphaproteobacteria bacterium]MDC3311135.1 cytidine deaminase [Alphaproteobacteria bacterium]
MLRQIDQRLCKAAISARHNAYAPYSKFKVGAAILDEFDNIHLGVNVENAAYPQGSCAEAGAISAMIAAGGQQIKVIAVSGAGVELCTPCGGCRQRIREFANPQTEILICNELAFARRFLLEELLPASFGPDNLNT